MTGRTCVVGLLLAVSCSDSSGAESTSGSETSGSETGSSESSGTSSDAESSDTSRDATSAGTSRDETSTGESSSSSATGEPAQCPEFGGGVDGGMLANLAVDEASGLAVSRSQPGVLWLHNDSGDSARVFAISPDGEALAEFSLTGATAVDWEDMALGPRPDADADDLYLADIGDNYELRSSLTIWRVEEPDVGTQGAWPTALDGAVALEFTYPDRPHNAETLLLDPQTGDLFIVTKENGGLSIVFRYAFPQDPHSVTTVEEVASLAFGAAPLPGVVLTTAGDVSSAGDLVVIRTYTHAFAWRRAPGTPLAEAFDTEPCPVSLESEVQGETIALQPDGQGYFTVSEGTEPVVWRFDRI